MLERVWDCLDGLPKQHQERCACAGFAPILGIYRGIYRGIYLGFIDTCYWRFSRLIDPVSPAWMSQDILGFEVYLIDMVLIDSPSRENRFLLENIVVNKFYLNRKSFSIMCQAAFSCLPRLRVEQR